MTIAENYQKIKKEVPDYISIVVAVKTRTLEEIKKVIDAGATDIGENYVQEAIKVQKQLGEDARKVKWHLIGKLQKNKINKALKIFDIIQTVDSFELAKAVDKRAKNLGKIVPVYIEINSGREPQKAGVMPEKAIELVKKLTLLKNIKIKGLMTMGLRFGNPEEARHYFKETKQIFDKIKALQMPNIEMNVLSMGMSNSYNIAIEEGSNMVRIGTAIFGERKTKETK